MTKTTSYEISKKLEEAGFEAEADYYWIERKERIVCVNAYVFSDYMIEGKKLCEAYDLETLLDALPAFVEHNKRMYYFWLWNDGIGYYPNCDRYSGDSQYDMENGIYEFSDDESLADTAGRMWLMLKEKGIVC